MNQTYIFRLSTQHFIIKLLAHRGKENRTPILDFEDQHSTIKLYPWKIRVVGIEPTNNRTKNYRLTTWLYPINYLLSDSNRYSIKELDFKSNVSTISTK